MHMQGCRGRMLRRARMQPLAAAIAAIACSCEPNVVVSFPGNDARAMFSAAGPIAAKSQLCISYIDADQSVAARREFLTFAYGFRCGCARCAEELADEAGRGA